MSTHGRLWAWDRAAFRKFLEDGDQREKDAEIPRNERIFKRKRIAEHVGVTTETLRSWHAPDRHEVPNVDQYEVLRHYFDQPDGAWKRAIRTRRRK